jgi:hypothetical protein
LESHFYKHVVKSRGQNHLLLFKHHENGGWTMPIVWPVKNAILAATASNSNNGLV